MKSKFLFLDLFKTYKLKNYRKTLVGFGSLFWRILRNTETNTYSYSFRDLIAGEYRQLHKGEIKIKFLTPFVLSLFCIVFNLFWIPFVIITYIPYSYFEGAKNWIIDSAWQANVRFFTWVNIFIIALLTVLLIIK